LCGNLFKALPSNLTRELAFKLQLQDIISWMQSLPIQYGYFGVFLISLIGALSVFFPIPYTVIIFTLGGQKSFEPLWIAVAAGIGSALGEFSGYFLGYGGRRVISDRFKRKMSILTRVFEKYGAIVIFLFALTPLPDDLLFIPLGVMHYSIVKIFIPALIGKFLMNLIVAYSGLFSIQIIRDIFGVDSDLVSALVGVTIALILLVTVFVVMFKVDWEKYLVKHMLKE